MITEDYVSFETAKLLKENGFPLPSTNFKDWIFCMYDENGDIQWGCYHPDYYARVTLQMAMKWLREVHDVYIDISIYVITVDILKYNINVYYKKHKNDSMYLGIHLTEECSKYEEAAEAAIKYCIEKKLIL